MTTLYCARWVLPISSLPIEDGAIAITEDRIADVGPKSSLQERFPEAVSYDFGSAAILPGFVNAHSHLELTAMRGFLEADEANFFGWLRKLTVARLERMTADDRYVSAMWGACEAVRAGVTAVADASDDAFESMRAVIGVGLRGTVFQESFGPDPRLATENFEKLKTKVASLREHETQIVRVGVSPHAPYTVCAPQLELIADFAIAEGLPLMMHAAESAAEEALLRAGEGLFADALSIRGIQFSAPLISPIQYLERHGILNTKPLLAHCIRVDDADIETLKNTGARVAHCPKSNAKLGHGRAPFASFLTHGIQVGIGSDSVASNNTCDILEETRFAVLLARSDEGCAVPDCNDALRVATLGGAEVLGLDGQAGELIAGRQADFTVVSLAGTHQLPSYDPISTLIFASSGRDVVLTVVAGREVFREGRVVTVDEERLGARMNEIQSKLNS
ncbi:MAG TPA: amidohydrolase family protein [Pyrinomonadaceae bacterium]|nr:amidohydrolase family protein [Pyrinomonadaceae bacterium]